VGEGEWGEVAFSKQNLPRAEDKKKAGVLVQFIFLVII
jgi:hypothetical protein